MSAEMSDALMITGEEPGKRQNGPANRVMGTVKVRRVESGRLRHIFFSSRCLFSYARRDDNMLRYIACLRDAARCYY